MPAMTEEMEISVCIEHSYLPYAASLSQAKHVDISLCSCLVLKNKTCNINSYFIYTRDVC